MRIIAGTARSLPLKTPHGKSTRPSSDKVKETLFNMLQSKLPGSVFLDLCAGSGGIGLEALSRGAKKAVFVENDRKALACIKENIRFTNMQGKSMVVGRDVLIALRLLEGKERFDLAFLDPPYDLHLAKDVLECLSKSSLIDEDSLVIVEASLKTDFSYLEDLGYGIVKRKEYKTNAHIFLRRNRRKEDEASDLSGQL